MRALVAFALIMLAGSAGARDICTPYRDNSDPPEVYAQFRTLAFDAFYADPNKRKRSLYKLMELRHEHINAFRWSICEVDRDEAIVVKIYEEEMRYDAREAVSSRRAGSEPVRPRPMTCIRVAGALNCI